MSGVTATGFDRPRLDAILEDIIARMKAPSVLGADAVLDGTTPDGQIVGIVAEIKDVLMQMAEDVYNAIDPNAATGQPLFRIGTINGITYKTGSKDSVMCRVHVKQGETLDAGAQVRDAETGVLFETLTDVGPSEGDATNYFVEARATEYGTAKALTTHTAEKVVEQYGWIDVAFATDSPGGTKPESITQFRRRRASSVAKPAQGITDGMYAALADLPGIGDVKIFENKKSSWADIKPGDGAIPPNSCIVLVRHAVVVDGVDKVAQTIWLYEAPGTDYYAADIEGTGNAVNVSVVDKGGVGHNIGYYVSQPMISDVRIEYKPIPGEGFSGDEDENALKDALVDWVENNLAPGDDLSYMDLAPVALGAVVGRSGGYAIKLEAIKICAHGGTPLAADLSTPFWQHVSLARANVTLVDVS